MSEHETDTKLNNSQKKRRVTYVGDRVAFGVTLSFLFLLGFLYWYQSITSLQLLYIVILILIGLSSYILYEIVNEEFYYTIHIYLNPNIIFVQITWFCCSALAAIFFATAYAIEHIILITTIYLALYITGYLIARIIFTYVSELDDSMKLIVILMIIIGILITSILISIAYYASGNGLMGTSVLIYGIGSIIFTIINYYMLKLFLGESGIDIIEDPPSKLINIGIVNTMIVNFILWIIMLMLIPLGGGSSKKKSKGRSGKTSYTRNRYTSSRSYYRRRVYRRYRTYVPGKIAVSMKDRASVNQYWAIALGTSEKLKKFEESEVEIAKEKILNELYDEGSVPRSNDLQLITEIPHLLFGVAFEELKKEGKIQFHPNTYTGLWTRGFCLDKDIHNKIKSERKEIPKEESEKIYKEQVGEFIKKVQERGPIKKKEDLWKLGEEVGIRPRWRINTTIDDLKKKGKLVFFRKKPKGWTVSKFK